MVNSSSNLDGGDTDDFDSLLKQARAGIRNKWYQEIISRKKWIIINDATILFVQISHHKKNMKYRTRLQSTPLLEMDN